MRIRKADRIRLRFYLCDEDVYRYYMDNFTIGINLPSPFRDEKSPSLRFYERNGRVLWKDFGLAEQYGKDYVSFVMHLFDVDEVEACNMIWDEVVIGYSNMLKNKRKVERKAHTKVLKVTTRPLRDFEYGYWRRAFVPDEVLAHYNVSAVDAAYADNALMFTSTPEDPAYYYDFGYPAFKTYRPLTKARKYKFMGKNNGGVIEGYAQLPPQADHLIVTKSLKDVIVLRSIGVLAIAPPSESNLKPIILKKEELQTRFDRVFILFDNDKAGIAGSNLLHKNTGWEQIYLKGAKDCYDTVIADGSPAGLISFFKPLKLDHHGYRY